jgi:hypothetical protein
VGVFFPIWKTFARSRRRELAFLFKFFLFTLLRTFLHSRKTQLFCFQAIPHSLHKTPGACRGYIHQAKCFFLVLIRFTLSTVPRAALFASALGFLLISGQRAKAGEERSG